jgi:hypothetical protein
MSNVQWITSFKRSKDKSERYRRVAMTLFRATAFTFMVGTIVLMTSSPLRVISLAFFVPGIYTLVTGLKYYNNPGMYATTNNFISRLDKEKYVDKGRLEDNIDFLLDANQVVVSRKRKRRNLTEYTLINGIKVQISCLFQEVGTYLLIIQIVITDEDQIEKGMRIQSVLNKLDVLINTTLP